MIFNKHTYFTTPPPNIQSIPSCIISETPKLDTGDVIRLKSRQGDYLYRPDTADGVTTRHTGIGNLWTVVRKDDSIQLKSLKGDYLRRADTDQGITTGNNDLDNSWKIDWNGESISLKSSKGDFLHRAKSGKGVTTQQTGAGNNWSVEIVARGKILVE